MQLLWPWRWRQRAWSWPVVVLLTRTKPRGEDLDDDNLRGSLKAVRDQVAAELGADDGDRTRLRFEYSEARGPWGVRIQLLEAAR